MNQTDNISGNLSVTAANYTELRAIKFTVYLLICLISVTGNVLVILSVVFFKRLKTVPNIFIANLAACDLVTTLSSIPFDLPTEELGYWPYGAAMCKILWPLATFSSTSAAFTLVSISADRYGALVHPLNFKYKITKKKCAVVMLCVYIFAALVVAPYFTFLKHFDTPGEAPQCGEDWPDLQLRKTYTVFLFSVQYGLPLIIMSYIYIRLGCLLHENTKKASVMSSDNNSNQPKKLSQYSSANSSNCPLQRRKEQNEKTIKMFYVIVMIFLVFMLPNQILWLLYDFGNSQELMNHIDLVAFVCRAFTYTNSVLNAVVYGACNRSFRLAFKAIMRCQCGTSHQREASRSVYYGRNLVSEVNTTRTLSPSLIRDKAIKAHAPRYRKPNSFDSVNDSSNSDFMSPSSPGVCRDDDNDDDNGNLCSKKLLERNSRNSIGRSSVGSAKCNGAARDTVVINDEVQVFTFES